MSGQRKHENSKNFCISTRIRSDFCACAYRCVRLRLCGQILKCNFRPQLNVTSLWIFFSSNHCNFTTLWILLLAVVLLFWFSNPHSFSKCEFHTLFLPKNICYRLIFSNLIFFEIFSNQNPFLFSAGKWMGTGK